MLESRPTKLPTWHVVMEFFFRGKSTWLVFYHPLKVDIKDIYQCVFYDASVQ